MRWTQLTRPDTIAGQRTFRIGTRGSSLALRQTEIVLDRLRARCPDLKAEIVPIQTTGDRQSERSLQEIGGRGVFVKELERALTAGEIDIAAHSLKDLPSEMAEGLQITGVGSREMANDVLVSHSGASLRDLPPGAMIGTGSPRRAAQLLACRSDLRIVDIRGNVDTRLRKVQAGEVDAIVLAAAGLLRLGRFAEATEVLPFEVMLPAVGQGILALETRTADPEAGLLAASVEDRDTRFAVEAERSFQRRLGGGCQAAIAALATVSGSNLHLRGLVADAAGHSLFRDEIAGPATEAGLLGRRLAERLLEQGASSVLEASP
ncbi:MAG TPA: hydroxymethylbilane synthase [Dehalococcoidia bacterium]|nr:hydroxymethylbilane synthase [Dehalococcoidia bacterium]